MVTPFAGVWIEIAVRKREYRGWTGVTPFAGVWIEMNAWLQARRHMASLPLRECGLKYQKNITASFDGNVTPFAGVWIEIGMDSACNGLL